MATDTLRDRLARVKALLGECDNCSGSTHCRTVPAETFKALLSLAEELCADAEYNLVRMERLHNLLSTNKVYEPDGEDARDEAACLLSRLERCLEVPRAE